MRAVSLTLLWLAGCTATVPDGIYACEHDADCPPGLECRPDEEEGSYCSRPGTDGPRAGRGGSGAGRGAGTPGGGRSGAGSGGVDAGGSGSGPEAGGDATVPPAKVAPSPIGFRSLGGVRSGG